VLKKISDIENFINSAIENLNQTKSFKVHDLSITEKVRPLNSYLGNGGDKPPKSLNYNTEGNRVNPALSTSLTGKIMDTLNKSRAESRTIPKIKSKFPQSNFKDSPSFLRSKNNKDHRRLKQSQTPHRSRMSPHHQSTLSFQRSGMNFDMEGNRGYM